MDAVKFLKTLRRMCNENPTCNQCELYKSEIACTGILCKKWMEEYPEDAVAFMEKWATEHPAKTRQSVFLEQYPEAKLTENGVLAICPIGIYSECGGENGRCVAFNRKCDNCRREFWLAEVENAETK